MYNGPMAKADPYEVLGVARGSTVEVVRTAFRKAALKYHPDLNPGDAQAERKFRELIDAYQEASRNVGFAPWDEAQKFTPGDFARMNVSWFAEQQAPAQEASQESAPPGTPKMIVARLNEPKVFIGIWVVAILLAVVAVFVIKRFRLIVATGDEDYAAMAKMVGTMIGVYLALVAGAIALLILTRKTVWLISRLRLGMSQRALPGAHKELPRNAPRFQKPPVEAKK